MATVMAIATAIATGAMTTTTMPPSAAGANAAMTIIAAARPWSPCASAATAMAAIMSTTARAS